MPVVIEKLMSITRAELEHSLAALDPAARLDAAGRAQIAVDGVAAVLTFEELPRRRLGGLIHMPQARVRLEIMATGTAAAATFRQRFEIAFQRGGG